MVFKFKEGIAECQQWQIWNATTETTQGVMNCDVLYLMFPNYSKSIDLRAGAKEELFKILDQKVIDLREYEL